MAPTKRTSLTRKAKSCDPGQAQALETWHKSTQCSRATRHHRIWLFSQHSWHLEDELGPIGFIIQPLTSATLVRPGGGWFNRILLCVEKPFFFSPNVLTNIELSTEKFVFLLLVPLDCIQVKPLLFIPTFLVATGFPMVFFSTVFKVDGRVFTVSFLLLPKKLKRNRVLLEWPNFFFFSDGYKRRLTSRCRKLITPASHRKTAWPSPVHKATTTKTATNPKACSGNKFFFAGH